MNATLLELTEDEFDDRFKLVPNHLNRNESWAYGDGPGCLFETYGEELALVRQQDLATACTLVDGDDGDMYVVSGFHFVNRIGYLISTVPVPNSLTLQVHVPMSRGDNDNQLECYSVMKMLHVLHSLLHTTQLAAFYLLNFNCLSQPASEPKLYASYDAYSQPTDNARYLSCSNLFWGLHICYTLFASRFDNHLVRKQGAFFLQNHLSELRRHTPNPVDAIIENSGDQNECQDTSRLLYKLTEILANDMICELILLLNLVRMKGLEPPRDYSHSPLKAACLPVSPHPRDNKL